MNSLNSPTINKSAELKPVPRSAIAAYTILGTVAHLLANGNQHDKDYAIQKLKNIKEWYEKETENIGFIINYPETRIKTEYYNCEFNEHDIGRTYIAISIAHNEPNQHNRQKKLEELIKNIKLNVEELKMRCPEYIGHHH